MSRPTGPSELFTMLATATQAFTARGAEGGGVRASLSGGFLRLRPPLAPLHRRAPF